MTQEGTILGTFQYMAPEQLEGKDADARTDIFAFGAVLYEMATGKKAFSAGSQASLITAIMSSEPAPISSVQPMSPLALDRVVKTCLAKDPEDRWQSAADAGRQLRWLGEASQTGAGQPVPAVARRGRRAVAWGALALGLLVGVGLAAVLLRRGSGGAAPAAGFPLHLELDLTAAERLLTASTYSGVALRIAPDGRAIVYVARKGATTELRYRSLETGESRPIPGTVGALDPFFSPDGRWVAFSRGLGLQRVALSGGTPLDVAVKAAARGGTWGPDGSIYFARELYGGISRVSQDGGAVTAVTELDKADGEKSHRWPEILPGGKALVYAALTGRSWDEAQIVLKRLDTGERRVLIRGGTSPQLRPDGASRLWAGPVAVRRALRPRAPRGDGPAGRDGPRRLHRNERRRRCGVCGFGAARLRSVELDSEPPPPDARRPARRSADP